MASETMFQVDGHICVELTQGHSALISPQDAPRIVGHKWHAVRCEDLRPDVAWDVLRMQAGERCQQTGKPWDGKERRNQERA